MTRKPQFVAMLFFLALCLLCLSCALFAGCRKKKRKGVRCAFHKKTSKMLKSVKDETALPPEERAVLMSYMIENRLLKRRADQRKALYRIHGATKAAPFRGNWILAMDGRLSFRLMAEVLYTANQAEMSRPQILVRNPDLLNRVVLIYRSRIAPPKAVGTFVPLGLTVVMTKKGYHVKSRRGVECPDPKPQSGGVCFPVDKGGFAGAARKLSHHLWFLYAKKYKDPSHWNSDPVMRSTITVLPAPRIPVRDVVLTLDAVREVPKDAKDRPAPKKSGCVFEFHRKTSEWRLKKKSGPACMFHNAVLALDTTADGSLPLQKPKRNPLDEF